MVGKGWRSYGDVGPARPSQSSPAAESSTAGVTKFGRPEGTMHLRPPNALQADGIRAGCITSRAAPRSPHSPALG
eukprot:4864037-Prymnesium_polylepis.2